jgi:hypothetical protein
VVLAILGVTLALAWRVTRNERGYRLNSRSQEAGMTAETATRAQNILRVTRRLIIMTVTALGVVVLFFAATLLLGERFPFSWVCFGCGLIGGFVSIQQRLKRIGDEELALLATSWFQIVLIPVYGGIFALVLYVGLLSKVVTGQLFPVFYIPPFHDPPVHNDVHAFLAETSPASGPDVAKLLFWCFVAGFSERFIPQIIGKADGSGHGR